MLARIKLLGSVRDVVRSTRDELNLPACATVQDLITALVEKHGEGLARRILSPDGQLQSYTRLFVDGREIDGAGLDRTALSATGAAVDVEVFVVQMTMGG